MGVDEGESLKICRSIYLGFKADSFGGEKKPP